MSDRFAEGAAIPPFVVEDLTRTDLVRYAGASGDFNPIHHDENFARAAGNPTVFGHGMLTAGLVARCITDFVGAGNLRRYKVRFATRVWPGDTITCAGARDAPVRRRRRGAHRRRGHRHHAEGRDRGERHVHGRRPGRVGADAGATRGRDGRRPGHRPCRGARPVARRLGRRHPRSGRRLGGRRRGGDRRGRAARPRAPRRT